ncbi:MAG: selenium-dependent molybdenum cofactor biosynthesis protein YqeB [candidate division Zixibacteria bacterium]
MTSKHDQNLIIIRGAGEMASGVIKKLFMAGFDIVAFEKPSPTCIRREVCFAEAVYQKEITVECVTAILVSSVNDALSQVKSRRIPILIDPDAECLKSFNPFFLIDARMMKSKNDTNLSMAPIVIGMGPGFTAGENCLAAIETNRGFDLGRVLYEGSTQAHTGIPASVDGISDARVLRASDDGVFISNHEITDTVHVGQEIGKVGNTVVACGTSGIIRGLIQNGIVVKRGQKIGDIDPRGIREFCFRISDKANAIGGGALEAVLALKSKNQI